MQGQEILGSKIGQKITDGRIQSFYLEGELIALINVTYLKFDEWISIISSDEVTSISRMEDSFEQTTSYGDESYFYPIKPIIDFFPNFNNYIGQQLIDYKELIFKKRESYGLNLFFENDLNLIIHNQASPIDKNEFIFENKIPKDLEMR